MNIKQNSKKIKWSFFVFAILSIAVPIKFVDLSSKTWYMSANLDNIQGFGLMILFFCSPVLCFITSLFFFIDCFNRSGKIYIKLLKIVLTYSIMIFSFASLYYLESYMGDYNDARSKFYHYNEFYMLKNTKPIVEKKNKFISYNYKLEDERAFRGINNRLWSGVDYNYRTGEVEFTDEIIANAENSDDNIPEIIKYIPENRFDVYVDCLYFSTITITTVGFGDISPSLWYSKVTVALEVIFGQALIVLAVGFFFYNLGSGEPKKRKR